jgi:hypothetical protein
MGRIIPTAAALAAVLFLAAIMLWPLLPRPQRWGRTQIFLSPVLLPPRRFLWLLPMGGNFLDDLLLLRDEK